MINRIFLESLLFHFIFNLKYTPLSTIASTPRPPYYAVIFSNELSNNIEGYEEMADQMVALAKEQHGFLGLESVRDGLGITVSYWKDLESIKKWKANTDHLAAQKKGRQDWYSAYKTRIAFVDRDYGMNA
jgi:heme-degrading monooxygenase HmoA